MNSIKTLTITTIAGLAATITGCASIPWATNNEPEAPIIYPQNQQWSAEPTYTAAQSQPTYEEPIYTTTTVIETTQAVNPEPQPTDTSWDTADGAWEFVEATGTAETPEPTPEPTPTPTPESAGPDMASKIYSGVLSLDLPMTGDAASQSQNTRNIQQISFAHDGSNFDPMVGPQGKTLLFASTQHRPTADIYMQKVGSKVITRLTDDPAQDVMPALSPDSQRIAFTSNRAGSWDIYVMPVNGGKAVQISSDSANDLHPSWSPDGQKLVFCRLGETSGQWELWIVDVFNTAKTQFIGYGLFPEWCPIASTGSNGSDQILFQRSRQRGQRTFGIWTLDYNFATQQASTETELASSPEYALINPSWSPDAQHIVYAAVPNPDQWTEESRPTSSSLWMIGTDGRGQVNLTNGSSIDLMPTWGSNGRVFFVSDRSGIENLWGLEIAPAILAATGQQPTNEAFTTAPSDSD